MEMKLEVVLSSSIKRKKPWSRFCWLGMEKESIFLLDDNRISEINMVSGRTKKKTPKLQPLFPRVTTMAGSQNGMWLAGLLISGELFLWNRDKDSLKMVSAVPEVSQLVTTGQGTVLRLSLLVSGDGQRVLLLGRTGPVLLWECLVPQDLGGVRDGTVRGRWTQIESSETTAFPSPTDKEATHHSVFVKSQAVGDVCLTAFVFTSGEQLSVTFLKIQWDEGWESRLSPVGYSVHWVTKTYPLSHLVPPCQPVKSRGALVPAFSLDGLLLAVVLNQRDPRATQVLFVSTQNFVSVSSGLGGCGSKKLTIPPKYVRSYWVGCASWTSGGLYLACVLKRGSLLLLARLGGLVSLSTTGCNIEFGPAHFLPLHPLVTYRPPVPLLPQDGSLSSSGASLRDAMRQRYSVTWHPRLPYLIVSDGYMATMLRVPSRPSPTALMSALLLDTTEALERVRRLLGRSQPQARLESMSSLKFTASLQVLRQRETPVPTLPLCLLDEGGTEDVRALYERAQGECEEDSDDEGQYPGSRVEEGGRLEYASMFDTLHAQSDPQSSPEDSALGPSALLVDLEEAQRSLLTAWGLGLSLGGAMEQRERLLKYTARCAVRLAALLRLSDTPRSHPGGAWASRVLHLLRTLLSFLAWDAPRTGGGSCLGVTVELTKQFVNLLLSHSSERATSSQILSAAIFVLQVASLSLDQTYSLPQRAVHQGGASPSPHPTDTFSVPLLQEEDRTALLTHRRPSYRLLGVWRGVYRQALQYRAELQCHTGRAGWERELERVSHIVSQIQGALQGAGGQLEEGPTLHSVSGEQHFLSGAYGESARVWRAELWAERGRAGPRTGFLETRYCLALLYGQLFQYRLREAQGLCDHLARQLQPQAGPEEEEDRPETADPLHGGWLPGQVDREAACAVVQCLGRFMASYFTNQPLCILPPHSVDVLAPLHLPQGPGRRVVALSQSCVAGAVRSQQLSEVWTVDYALDLLLLGGLLPEAVWLAQHLGDWKTAASLGLAYTNYCRDHYDFSGLKWKELHLPPELQPGHIFQGQLESLLGGMAGSDRNGEPYKSFTDSMEEEDVELLQVSVQEILKASVMADVDVVSQPLSLLLDSAKELSSCLAALVPSGLYIPAPPLYCPQPAPNTQDSLGDAGLVAERVSRQRVSGVLQRALLLLRAARCSRPAAQWYTSSLRRCRQLFHKIRQRASEPRTDVLPEGLMKFVTRSGFFRQGHSGDGHMDSVTIQTIMCFRELCGLCWMLHVRDQLTVNCRRYQAARTHGRDSQVKDGTVMGLCVEALHWACRFLPFSRFLNAEEILQDLVLSLVSELPPVPMVAETLARAFPDEDESVRVPLREKYSSLLQRLRPCPVQAPSSLHATQPGSVEEEGEQEMMMLLIHDHLRQRQRERRRLGRYLAPPVCHLWEREEEEERGRAAPILERFSLGASLSNSTLTDCGRPLVCSDGDTAETLSEPLSPDLPARPTPSYKKQKLQDQADSSACGDRGEDHSPAAGPSGAGRSLEPVVERAQPKGPVLPVTGTWEFELQDEEYPRFLELFLSYVLEKDRPDGDEPEPPLLSSFSPQLRERELHSLTFDVLTTLRRRQRDGRPAAGGRGARAPVFRAGRCFQTLPDAPEPPPSSVPGLSVHSGALPLRDGTATPLLPGLRAGKQQGLFGLRRQGGPGPDATLGEIRVGSDVGPSPSSVPWVPQVEFWPFKALSATDADLQQELDPKLEAQFPRLGRLLEWMVRWADRRVLLPRSVRKTEEGACGPADAVVIRAKASAPAVLTALRLLELRYTLLATERHCAHFRVPERQFTVAPVLRPEMAWKVDGESSVDTGYPGSAGTPITLLDLDLQHGQAPDVCGAEEVEREQSASHLSDQEEVTSDPERKEVGPTADNEQEGDRSAAEAWESSDSLSVPNSSVQVKTHSRDQALTLADLECPETEEDSRALSQTAESQHSGGMLESAPADTEEESANRAVCEAPGPVPPQQPDQQSLPSAGSQPGPHTDNHPPSSGPPQSRPDTQTDPVRALLQDELFRLVQLQQINFMSLMQVVGASFVNLPFLQQNALLSQPNALLSQPNALLSQPNAPPSQPNALLSQPNALLSQPNALLSQPNALLSQPNAPPSQPNAPMSQLTHPSVTHSQSPSQTNMPLVPESPPRLSQHNQQPSPELPAQPCPQTSGLPAPASGLQHRRDRPADQQPVYRDIRPAVNSSRERDGQSNTALSTQEIQQLTIYSEWPRGCQTGGFIPPSRGLLATASTHVPPSASGRDPPPLIPLERTAPPAPGLKLLQLCPPQPALLRPPPAASVREAWGPHPLHLNPSQYDPAALRRWAAPGPAGPPKHLNLHQYSQPPRSAPPQTPEASAERSRGGETLHLPPAPHRAAPAYGLPLLRFHPETQRPTVFPHIPHPNPARPLTLGPGVPGHCPGIQLLQKEPEPPSTVLRYSAPPLHTPRLIPLEELMGWAAGRHQGADARLQLLKADTLMQSTVSATPSSKRQKRREDRRKEDRRVGVTFRPDDSIIPPAEEESALGEGYVIPPGSFDSMLTGQRLVDQAHATAAELHAFASTQKRPPEIHDACTNTDPEPPRSVSDEAISSKHPVSHTCTPASGGGYVDAAAVVPPDVFLSLRFSREPPPQQPVSTGDVEHGANVDAEGRRFINVIDLEDETLLQELPPRQTPRTVSPPPPTSAQLHLLAASVTNAAPTPLPTADAIPEEQPELDSPPPAVLQAVSEPSGDPVTLSLLMGTKAPGLALPPRRQVERNTLSSRQVSARLSEMDAQLAALQSIADHMDQEFANTRMLVSTIETIQPAMAPSVEDQPYSSTLTVTRAVRSSRPSVRHAGELADLREEEEKEEEEREAEFVASTPRGIIPPVKPERPVWESSQDLAESMVDNSGIRGEETLDLSGLSDVADILGELVREGGISPSALGLSHTQAARLSRPEEQPRQRGLRAEEERHELKAWMRRKQREKLVEYRKQREEKRQRESKPFTAPVTLNPTSRDLSINKKIKEERDKMVLLEHHTQRAREACGLITDLLNTPLPLPTVTTQRQAPGSARCSPRSRSQSTGRRRSLQTGRAHCLSSPGRTVVLHRRGAPGGHGTLSSRLGLHRPASALPGDRLSQVTRRGMLTDLRGRTGAKTTNQHQRRALSQSPPAQRAVGEREQRDLEETEERVVVSPWNPPLEIRRLLGLENQDVGPGVMEEGRECADRGAAAELGRLDTLSESTGSILSKLDWEAIERIVAGEGGV